MKRLNILFLIIVLSFTVTSIAQQADEQLGNKDNRLIMAKKEVQNRKIKIDLDRLPNSILVSLRDSYAKHFVTQAFKKSKNGEVFFIELRKGRTLFTVAVDNNGRVLKEIHEQEVLNQDALANKN